jgi:hypothetical protein
MGHQAAIAGVGRTDPAVEGSSAGRERGRSDRERDERVHRPDRVHRRQVGSIATNASRSAATPWSNSCHSTAALLSKYRKHERRLTPAWAAICSTVVTSKPWLVNSPGDAGVRAVAPARECRSHEMVEGDM